MLSFELILLYFYYNHFNLTPIVFRTTQVYPMPLISHLSN